MHILVVGLVRGKEAVAVVVGTVAVNLDGGVSLEDLGDVGAGRGGLEGDLGHGLGLRVGALS
jgi:hypothetical protein